jgi:hypothetical protein
MGKNKEYLMSKKIRHFCNECCKEIEEKEYLENYLYCRDCFLKKTRNEKRRT